MVLVGEDIHFFDVPLYAGIPSAKNRYQNIKVFLTFLKSLTMISGSRFFKAILVITLFLLTSVTTYA